MVSVAAAVFVRDDSGQHTSYSHPREYACVQLAVGCPFSCVARALFVLCADLLGLGTDMPFIAKQQLASYINIQATAEAKQHTPTNHPASASSAESVSCSNT